MDTVISELGDKISQVGFEEGLKLEILTTCVKEYINTVYKCCMMTSVKTLLADYFSDAGFLLG